MVSEKVRIYDLARELGVPSKDLMTILKDSLRIKVKSHSSTIDEDDAEKVRAIIATKKFSAPSPEIKEEPEPIIEKEQTEEPKQPTQILKEEPKVTKEEKLEEKARGVVEPQAQPVKEKQVPTEPQAEPAVKKQIPPNPSPERKPFQATPRQELPQRITKPTMNRQEYTKPVAKASLEPKEPIQHVQKPSYTPTKLPGVQPYTLSTNKYRRRPENKPYSSQKPSRYPTSKVADQGTTLQASTSATLTSVTTSVQEPPVTTEPVVQPEQIESITQPQVKEVVEIEKEQAVANIIETEDKEAGVVEPTITTEKIEKFEKVEPVKTIETFESPQKIQRPPHPTVRHQQQPKPQHPQQGFQPKPHRFPKPARAEGFERPAAQVAQEAKPKHFEKPFKSQGAPGQKEPVAGEALKSAKSPYKKDLPKKKEYYSKEKERYQDVKPLTEIFKKKKIEKKEPEIEKPTEVYIDKALTIAELANILKINSTEIIKELMKTGIFATLNQTISLEAARDAAEKLEYIVLKEAPEQKVEEVQKEEVEEEKPLDITKLQQRAPIVTIMGHVDHGKTTLLDAIRKTKSKIVETEIGGITQSIGAYTVEIDRKRIVFIDTPGHKAFTAMRARGASVTDIVIIIVAADDGVMPQTIEAISHAKAAGVPIIVAINKIDKPGADPDKVLQQLANQNLVPEKWGGDIITEEVSACTGENIEKLLEWIVLVADLHELTADPTSPASGVVIESELDKGKGSLARLIVQNGTLRVGDLIIVGNIGAKVRALINDEGLRINEAGPSTPVEVLGLSEVPQAGDPFKVVNDEKRFKQMLSKLKVEEKEKRFSNTGALTLQQDTIFKAKSKKTKDEIQNLNIIIKADTDGSVKAVEAVLLELKSKEVVVKIVHSGVGDISEADVMLALTSSCIIIGFRVKEDSNAVKVAQEQDVQIRTYDIIYEISDDIEKTMLGLLQPELREVELGVAEVRELFTIGKNLVIAGCYVLEGKITRNRTAKVYRNNKEIFKGNLDNLRRFKDDAKEVLSGFECGISFNKFNDLQVGDIIKVSTVEEIERENLN